MLAERRLEDHRPWVEFPGVEPDRVLASRFEESKTRTVNKERSEYGGLVFLLQLGTILYCIH